MKLKVSLSSFMDNIQAKMMRSSLALVLLMVCVSNISSTTAQFEYQSYFDCDKYCHRSCYSFFGADRNRCFKYKLQCVCEFHISSTATTGENPVLVIIFLLVTVMVISFCCGIYRICKGKQRRNTHRIVAQPVVPGAVVNAITGNNRRNSRNSNPSNFSQNISSTNNITRTSQTNSRGYVNPLSPQASNDVPPEYLPPPPYNECVFDNDYEPETEKSPKHVVITLNDQKPV